MCRKFAKIRQTNMAIRQLYITSINHYTEGISKLEPQDRLYKRSIAGSVRKFFNIGSYNKQRALMQQVNNLEDSVFNIEGTLTNFQFAIELEHERTTYLEQSLDHYQEVNNRLIDQFISLSKSQITETVLNEYTISFINDAITSGTIMNTIFMERTNHLRLRLKAMILLAKNRLSTDLISPGQLNSALDKLAYALQKEFPLIRLMNTPIYEYFTHVQAIGYVENNHIYVKLPIIIDLHNQVYTLYKLQTFPIPLPSNNKHASLILHDYDIIGVNREQNTYILTTNEFLKHFCRGDKIYRCHSNIFSQFKIDTMNSCELSIYKKDVQSIRKLCKIALIDVDEETKMTFILTENGSVFVNNPRREKVYLQCPLGRNNQFITDDAMFTITIKCMCWLNSQTTISPTFLGAHCLNDSHITHIAQSHTNLLYLSMLLETTIDEIQNNASLLHNIPSLQLPEQIVGLQINDEHATSSLDLKKILEFKKSNYKQTLQSRVHHNTASLSGISFIRTLAYITPGGLVMGAILFLVLFCRNKHFGRALALQQIIPEVTAMQEESHSSNFSDFLVLTIELISLVATILALIYVIFKHFTFFRKLTRYGSLPFKDCLSLKAQNPLQIMLYIASLKDHCVLHISEITYTPPHLLAFRTEHPIYIKMHNALFSSYLILEEGPIVLEISGRIKSKYQISKTISVPFYLKKQVKCILDQIHTINILIGNQSIYMSIPIPLQQQTITESV